MIELPFKMTFELDFSEKPPQKELLDKLSDLFSNIVPKPLIKIIFKEIDKNLYDFIAILLKSMNIDIIAINPVLSELLATIMNKQLISIKLSNNNYNLTQFDKFTYNLIIPASNTIYDYIKNINSTNINKIIIYHNNENKITYAKLKNQLNLLKKDNKINPKCYIFPYLEEYEAETYYSEKGQIRQFLTCASLWFNPVINSNGNIFMPCVCSKNTILEQDFFDLWDSSLLNDLRVLLINEKRLSICQICEKFYKDNFFVVEDCILEYKNHKYVFDNILNLVKSAPAIGIILNNNTCTPISLYSEIEIEKLYNNSNLTFIIK